MFKDDEHKTVMGVLSCLHSKTKDKRVFFTPTLEDIFAEIKFVGSYFFSVLDRSFFDDLGLKRVSDPNRGGLFIGCHEKVVKNS